MRNCRSLDCAIYPLIALPLLGTGDIRSAGMPRTGADEAGGMNDVALRNEVLDGNLG